MKLWMKVTLGLILGIMVGRCFPQYVSYIKPIGDIFLRLIKMIIAPLIFFSLVTGITSMSDPSTLGRVGMKSVAAFLGTTLCAVIFGISVALILKPGHGIHVNFDSPTNIVPTKSFNLINFFVEIIPDNAVAAFANSNVLQIVFFAIFSGVIINKMGAVTAPIKDLFHLFSKIILKMISVIIQLSPYGAFALTAWVVGTQGLDIMVSLSKLVISIVIAMLCQYGIFGILIYVFGRISPLPFYKKSLEYQILALSTGSSKASLGTTMKVCQEKLGISESSTSFILPLGASINMDGFAINLGLTTIFFAQMMGIDLAFHDYLVIILTSTLGSIGGAGIPGASLIMLPMVLSSVNMPIEGVAMIAGIDRVLDLLRTAINITGDATITLIIDSSEGTLDREKYLS
ncbi:dicarboxylate/amino acid:cation symporter [Candidatus Tisiphia endosymbiont of Beris chalybata]|uniref:dicarboxylate/amino acid:cation symporter n=1 Tax=Candidatus Tisiphia endosymbiont of Beris chalybata TaxID=3066262 RepID=UPI00312C903E